MTTFTIDGRQITAKGEMTVLDAALSNGIDIPHICDHPMLEKYGGCRMCLVSVENSSKLVTSCTLKPSEGMVVETETPEVLKARKAVLEFMLINHPLECPSCDKAGLCKLQDYAVRYGAASGRFNEEKLVKEENLQDPLIKRNMGRCILCTRCVRVCAGVQGVNALAPVLRGNKSFIAPFAGDSFDCEYCGNCISICPVGALTSTTNHYGARTWEAERHVMSACPHCGMGCKLEIESGKRTIQRISAVPEDPASRGILCARGKFGHVFIESPERLTSPLVREDGELRQASWDEAIDRVSEGLRKIKAVHGGESIAGIASSYCTNEDNYMLQRLMRSAFGSNNIDSTSRLGIAASKPFVESILGPGATATAASRVTASDAVIVLGGDPFQEMPVLGVKVRNAFMNGATVVSFGHTPGLVKHSTYSISLWNPRAHLSSNMPVEWEWLAVEALLANVIKLRKSSKSGEKDNALEDLLRQLKLPKQKDIADSKLKEYLASIAEGLIDKETVTIISGRGTAAHEHGARNLLVVSALTYALGAKLILSSRSPNENGLLDMGCVPDSLPGGVSLDDKDAVETFESTWNCTIPRKPGLSLMEMFEAAQDGRLKAMYVMGSNPAASLPGSRFVRDAMEKLDMLVVQDIFMTATARMADVVLPAAGWAEKEGTYTNFEQRLIHLEKAVEGSNMPDWQILSDLSVSLGVAADFSFAEEVFEEAARLNPLQSGLSYGDIEAENVSRREKMMLQERQSIPDLSELYKMPPVPEKNDCNLVLEKSTYSSGTLSRHASTLKSVCRASSVGMNAETARGLGIEEGSTVEVITDIGSVVLTASIVPYLQEGVFVLSSIDQMPGIMDLFRHKVASHTLTPYAHHSGVKIVLRPGGQAPLHGVYISAQKVS